MARRILFVTTDQQRYDALGCNGGQIARTPVVDQLAANGVRYERALPQNVVCMPSRATMLTGQHIRNHGVWMNGVPLPTDSPTVASLLHDAGWRTGLFGKAHFEPLLDPFLRFPENRMGFSGATDEDGKPHRGFERMELAGHGSVGYVHYAAWLRKHHPELVGEFYLPLDRSLDVNSEVGGDTGAPQICENHVPKDLYHTEWVADRALAWLDGLNDNDDWFCWLSFPDPHHPWDPPESELHRVSWRDLDLPVGYPTTRVDREALLDAKSLHWRRWYDGDLVSNYEAPAKWIPATLTPDQVREVNARVHIENELIDEALGRVIATLTSRGWDDDTHVFFTTDHGEFQGDHGLLFKGPYHVDSLMRLPLIWRPAPATQVRPAVVDGPVGLLDLAPTFCQIAGIDVPGWMDGAPLPVSRSEWAERGRPAVLTEWDSTHPSGAEVHMQTITVDGSVCTRYEPGTSHVGDEGELWDLFNDPLQQRNLWAVSSQRSLREEILTELKTLLPDRPKSPLRVEAPV